MSRIVQWLEAHAGTCTFHEASGAPCPGCGLQRSILSLLRGEVWDSFLFYPALIPLSIMFIFLGVHLVFKLKHGAMALKILFITNASLIAVNYLVKLFIL